MEGSTYTIEIENFAGPLDLLLKLIERQKLNICDISLSQVTGDYLASIQDMAIDPHQANWFLDIASRLILYKSRALLPSAEQSDQDPIDDLAEQLNLLAKIRAAGKELVRLSQTPLALRKKTLLQIKSSHYPNLNLDNFASYYPKPDQTDTIATKRFKLKRQNPIYLRQKIEDMWLSEGSLNLDRLEEYCDSRYETVVCFLLALEKLKDNRAKVVEINNILTLELV